MSSDTVLGGYNIPKGVSYFVTKNNPQFFSILSKDYFKLYMFLFYCLSFAANFIISDPYNISTPRGEQFGGVFP